MQDNKYFRWIMKRINYLPLFLLICATITHAEEYEPTLEEEINALKEKYKNLEENNERLIFQCFQEIREIKACRVRLGFLDMGQIRMDIFKKEYKEIQTKIAEYDAELAGLEFKKANLITQVGASQDLQAQVALLQQTFKQINALEAEKQEYSAKSNKDIQFKFNKCATRAIAEYNKMNKNTKVFLISSDNILQNIQEEDNKAFFEVFDASNEIVPLIVKYYQIL